MPPFTLELAALNRDLSCFVLYETVEFKRVDCGIDFWGFDTKHLPNVEYARTRERTNMGSALVSAGAAVYECQDADHQNFQVDPSNEVHNLYWLSILCGKSNRDK